MAYNAKRMKDHLYSYESYLKDQTNAQSWIIRNNIRAKILIPK